jgi:hypothetical protein
VLPLLPLDQKLCLRVALGANAATSDMTTWTFERDLWIPAWLSPLAPRPSICVLVHHIKGGCENGQHDDSFDVLCCDVSGGTAGTRGEACPILDRDAPRSKLGHETVRSARKQPHVDRKRFGSVKAFLTASAAPQPPWRVLVSLGTRYTLAPLH